ncbi:MULTISPECIES: hypothetical protein [Bacillaceae]|jgi:hypothetical protein|uniref:hypothetical protein n=1 Tax=Bacillaceae TaxID=186817 RepID=UPI0017CF5BFB|nr:MULTISPECIES: hypothetical protein [Bacillaceae]MCB5936913.1 hypothetical protein [Bacillus sp. DFI.2.34]MCB7078698.1 hypothetical protein [Caldibacillus thermoamylovorans]MEC5271983.1 hypothetical protein [Caldifermentibacillus hisashii]NWN98517.1 hypothetical protein [Bacillus sp. (in: firmicutes)]
MRNKITYLVALACVMGGAIVINTTFLSYSIKSVLLNISMFILIIIALMKLYLFFKRKRSMISCIKNGRGLFSTRPFD